MLNKTINHVNMQNLATFVILLVMSPVLLVLVVVSTTYLLRVLLAISAKRSINTAREMCCRKDTTSVPIYEIRQQLSANQRRA